MKESPEVRLSQSPRPRVMRLVGQVHGKMHTPKAGNKEIDVPLVQMNALLGLLSDILFDSITQLPQDSSVNLRTLRAFQKLLWIQNDFINRHYQNC